MRALLFCIIFLLTAQICFAQNRDSFGYWQKSKQYNKVANSGIIVVDMPEEESYFVVWAPRESAVDRAMVLLHGTGGTAYDELADEFLSAQANNYGLIAIQWLNKRTKKYYDPPQVYRMIKKALKFYNNKYGNLKVVALCGFSRGGAISYEVAYLDNISSKQISFIIAHSGGIPTNSVLAPGEHSGPGKFYEDLALCRLTSAFIGKKFFLYAGCQDEEWQDTMCEYMRYTKDIIEENGGKVVGFIIDEQGRHGGYRSNKNYHKQAIDYFLSLN